MHPKIGRIVMSMTTTANNEKARGFLQRMISNESHGPNDMISAMRRIDRDWGIPYWTQEYIRKGKAKAISVSRYEQIRNAYLAHCEWKIKSLAHEIRMERASGYDVDQDLLVEAEALLSKIQSRRE